MRHLNPLAPEIKHHPHDGGGLAVALPVNLDPGGRHRIIAEHWFGWRPIGEVAAVIVSDLRSRCQAKRQYAEGLG